MRDTRHHYESNTVKHRANRRNKLKILTTHLLTAPSVSKTTESEQQMNMLHRMPQTPK